MTDTDFVEVLITLAIPEALVEDLRKLSPRLHITTLPVRRAEEIPQDIWARTEILYTDRVLPSLNQATSLKWIQFHFTGIDFAVESPLVQSPDLAITTISGASSLQTAEYIFTMILALGHHIPDLIVHQNRAEWPRDRWERFTPVELRGSTVGIVGYGSIGRELARLLQPFNVSVLAAKRDAMHPEDMGYAIEGTGDPDGQLFTRLYPSQALRSMVKECDFVVVSVPLTPGSRGLVNADVLAAMKPSAYLIDIGRGGVVDPNALLDVLQNRRIAGAALDVFSEEPLPPASPFWRLPNVIISPHIGGISQLYKERAMKLFSANLQRYLSGMPLLNRFDPNTGY
jgi:phosphoglycerate dehydrogenase-like enzyme